MKNHYAILAILFAGCMFSACIKSTLPKPTGGGSSTSGNNIYNTANGTTSQQVAPVNPNLLEGSWRVVNDASTTVPWGLWAGHPTTGSNYVGQPADYYQFTTAGNCYTRINGVVDTASYTLNQNQVHVVFTYFNGQESTTGIYNSTWTVSNLTANTCALTVTYVTPETAITSVTNLVKN